LQITKKYGRSAKKPPFSYMTLIQLALNSREDKRMTLKEICKWIEENFPFFKHTAKPGWKVKY
jgi:forkhead box protein M